MEQMPRGTCSGELGDGVRNSFERTQTETLFSRGGDTFGFKDGSIIFTMFTKTRREGRSMLGERPFGTPLSVRGRLYLSPHNRV